MCSFGWSNRALGIDTLQLNLLGQICNFDQDSSDFNPLQPIEIALSRENGDSDCLRVVELITSAVIVGRLLSSTGRKGFLGGLVLGRVHSEWRAGTTNSALAEHSVQNGR